MNKLKMLFNLIEPSHKKVFDLIRREKRVSAAELARITGMQASSMVYILRKLSEKGLIVQSGIGKSTNKGGKRPTLWEINTGLGVFIGIEVMPSKLRVALYYLNNEHGTEFELECTQLIQNRKSLLDELTRAYDRILQMTKLSDDEINCYSIALPGLIDNENGVLKYSRALNISDYDLLSDLKEYLNVDCFIINDANAGVLGLKWYNYPDLNIPEHVVYIEYNQEAKNLGAGLIINNKLYQGFSGNAGEILHELKPITSIYNELKGNYSDSSKLGRLVNGGLIDIEALSQKEKDGNKAAKAIFVELSDIIAEELLHITGFINPGAIVIGGELTGLQRILHTFILPAIKAKSEEMEKLGYIIPHITFSPFGKYAVAKGAIGLSLEKIVGINN